MISVLVVGAVGAEEEPESSVEVLHAATADEAIEKLGRNRRIDAVLVLAPDPAEVVLAIAEDVVAPPPLFVAAEAPEVRGARRLDLTAREPSRLLERIAAELSA